MAGKEVAAYIYEDWWRAIEGLTPRQQDAVVGALVRLFFTGEADEESLPKRARMPFLLLRRSMLNHRAAAFNGRAGGKASKPVRGASETPSERASKTASETPSNKREVISNKEEKGMEKEKPDPALEGEPEGFPSFVGDCLGRYTAETGRSCLIPSGEVTGMLRRLFDAGYSPDDVALVCRSKAAEWARDAQMQRYLRPQTLFGGKFEGYLNAAKAEKGVTDDVPEQIRDAF